MQLHYSSASPFVRKVMITLHEADLLTQVKLVPVTISPIASGEIVPAHNPLGKIPCLVRDDGPALYDSRVICRYLSSLAPNAGLYPEEPSLWEALVLEATADGIMDAAVTMTYEHRVRPEEKVHQPWLDAQWLKIDRTLSVLEQRWMPYLNGRPYLPVLSIAAALGYIDLRHDNRNWRASHPKLAEWEAAIVKRPSLAQTLPKT